MFTLLTLFTSALTALAGPIPPLPGQPEPGHNNVFFQPVKLLDANYCFDERFWGIAYGDPVHINQCPGDFGSWIWKPVKDSREGEYHLTLLGMDRCVGFDRREHSWENGTQVVFAKCDSPDYQTKWIWKGDNLCSDEGPLAHCIGVEGEMSNGATLRTSTRATERKPIRLSSVVIGSQ